MNILIKTKIGKNEYLFPLKEVDYNVQSGIEQIIFWNLCDGTNCKSISYKLNISQPNHQFFINLNNSIDELQGIKSTEFLEHNEKLVKLNYIILNLKIVGDILEVYAAVPYDTNNMLMNETASKIEPYLYHKFYLDIHSEICIQNTSGKGDMYIYKKINKKKGMKDGKRS